MTNKELMEWLDFKCAITRGKYRGQYEAIRARLVAAEKMAETLRGIADRHGYSVCDVRSWTMDRCDTTLKQWEDLG